MEMIGPDEQFDGRSGVEKARHGSRAGHRHKRRKLWRDVKWALIAFAGLCVLNVLTFELHW